MKASEPSDIEDYFFALANFSFSPLTHASPWFKSQLLLDILYSTTGATTLTRLRNGQLE